MFNVFDRDNDDLLDGKEFKEGIGKLFANCFEDNLKLVYDLFDFDGNGSVSKEDMRILLSHVPLAHLLELTEAGTPKVDHSLDRRPGT